MQPAFHASDADLKVDLYSDTVTRPTAAMRQAIAEAEVGNEQAGEDPSVNKLCAMVMELLGKEDAVFLPSGTMCNEIAYRVHCEPGDEVILDATGHALHFETGGPAALSGLMTRTLSGERGIFTADQVRAAIRAPGRHHPRSRLLSVENTNNLGSGAVWPLVRIEEVCAAAHEAGLKTHLDGARLLNAVVASGTPARDYARPFDSIWIDLSKGLGCPVGAVLAGSRDFIDRAWIYKQQMGGAMRQAGIIAAAGIYALEHNIDRLAEDHANAKLFAESLRNLPGIAVDPETVETNIVFFDIAGSGMTAEPFCAALKEKGVDMGGAGTRIRAVTHLDVSRDAVMAAVDAIRAVLQKAKA